LFKRKLSDLESQFTRMVTNTAHYTGKDGRNGSDNPHLFHQERGILVFGNAGPDRIIEE
jgi:hypothetical protein